MAEAMEEGNFVWCDSAGLADLLDLSLDLRLKLGFTF
jgi:hypothetical protein